MINSQVVLRSRLRTLPVAFAWHFSPVHVINSTDLGVNKCDLIADGPHMACGWVGPLPHARVVTYHFCSYHNTNSMDRQVCYTTGSKTNVEYGDSKTCMPTLEHETCMQAPISRQELQEESRMHPASCSQVTWTGTAGTVYIR